MKKIDKIHCIICKVLTIIVILMGVLFTPFQYYYNGLEFTTGSIFGLSIISSFIIMIGLKGLLETNNPISKWNPFSFNPLWTNKR